VRLVQDGFVAEAEAASLAALLDSRAAGLQRLGAESLLVLGPSARRHLGPQGLRLAWELLERTRRRASSALNLSEVFHSGAMLKRLDHPPLLDHMQAEPGHSSFGAHVDKANIASYDYSALVYLSSVGQDFGGGELAFNDADVDRVLQPRVGRLVMFSSGLENLHQVLPMSWGQRHVLSMWFTCSRQHANRELVRLMRGKGRRRRGAHGHSDL